MQDLPVLLGPTNTDIGRSSMLASAMGPKLETVNSRGLALEVAVMVGLPCAGDT